MHTLHPTRCQPTVPAPLHTSYGPPIRLLHILSALRHFVPARRLLARLLARLLIGIGGGDVVRHGRPLEPTKPGQGHSHHSRVTAAHSKQ
ncbi:hypothetical protein CgunFtcFv8_007140 [Champsocephalus gunnari]|uniref:Uncharacterized protein n=1 Tax=Champsocephalus gunnari TaxID=52237 RepID=A0AAN8H5L3_CHAGU|nr:hypothetical protein CgunFtcFv8_007140 [Champsocephalus gunnari]